jgi:hypothetical protein
LCLLDIARTSRRWCRWRDAARVTTSALGIGTTARNSAALPSVPYEDLHAEV